MIFTTTLVLALLIFGFVFGIFKGETYLIKDSRGNEDLNTKGVIKAIIVLLVSICLAILNPLEVQRIDAGNIGLKIDKVGDSKGVPVAIPVKGWVWYNAWISDIVEYSIRQNHVSSKPFSVTTKGGFSITVAPSYNYALKPEKAAALYVNLLKGNSFSSLEETWLMTATSLSLSNATNAYTIDSIFNYKQRYNDDVIKEMNREMSAYFSVSQINPGVTPPSELNDVIKSKTETIQKAQQAELDRITADAVAQTQIAKARGDSASAVIAAAGEAKAINLKTRELSPTYVDYIRWLNAGPEVPRVPSTMIGQGVPFILNQR